MSRPSDHEILSLEDILPINVWETVRAFLTNPHERLHVDVHAIGRLSLLQYYYALGKETANALMTSIIEGCECVGTESCELCQEYSLYDKGVLKIRNHRDLNAVLNKTSRSLKPEAFTGAYYNQGYINMLIEFPTSIQHVVLFPNLWSFVVSEGDSVLAKRELTRGIIQTCRGSMDRALSLSVKRGEDSRNLIYPMMETEHVPEREDEEKEAIEMEEEEMEMVDENGIVPSWTIGDWSSGDTMETETIEANGEVPEWSLTRDWRGELNEEKVLGRRKRSTLVPTWTFEKEKKAIESI